MLLRLHHVAMRTSAAIVFLCQGLLVIMTLVIAALVVSRYIFNYSFSWAEELTRLLLVWMVLLAAAVIQRRDDHIKVDFFVALLPVRLQALIDLVLRLLVLGFVAMLVWYGWTAAIGMYITKAPALGIPMTVGYLAIPACGLLMSFFTVLSLIDDGRVLIGLPRIQPDRAAGHGSH
ncbi:MAG: TRAP transporter small permease [Geminicoccaceae bacterium]|nr:TRAP transporter small permease [Geminicoccaceae bacterium]